MYVDTTYETTYTEGRLLLKISFSTPSVPHYNRTERGFSFVDHMFGTNCHTTSEHVMEFRVS